MSQLLERFFSYGWHPMGNGRDGTSASQDTASTFQPSIALRTAFALLLSFIHHGFLPFSSKLMRTAFSAADFGSPLFNYFLSVSVLISELISHRMWVKFFPSMVLSSWFSFWFSSPLLLLFFLLPYLTTAISKLGALTLMLLLVSSFPITLFNMVPLSYSS